MATANTAPSTARAGQLPPLRGTGSTITAYLQNPAEGLLPENTVFTPASYHSGLHIAYLGPPTIGVGVSSFGTHELLQGHVQVVASPFVDGHRSFLD